MTSGSKGEVVRLVTLYELVGAGVELGTVIVMSFSEASLRKVRDLDSRLKIIRLCHHRRDGEYLGVS